jgi:hypothetical protein
MKIKTICITIFCILFTGQVFASEERTTFKERTDNWLRSEGSGSGGPPTNGHNDPLDATRGVGDPEVPVGDGIWLALGFGLTYGIYTGKRKKAIEQRLL